MLHNLLTAPHTVCGVIALATGSLGLHPPARGEPPTFRVYLGALGVLVRRGAIDRTKTLAAA